MEHNVSLISTIAAAFGVALILGVIAERLKLPALVGYLLAGIIIGNELVMRAWRKVRDQELLTVEISFEDAQSARAAAESQAAETDRGKRQGGDGIPPQA